MSETIKAPTRMYFNAVGRINYKVEDFISEKSSQNNPNYKYCRLTLYLNVNNSKHRISLIGGFYPTTQLYALKKETGETFTVSFPDRFDKNILANIDEKSFKKILINEDDKTEHLFLSDFDFIREIPKLIPNKSQIFISGEISFNEYEGKLQKNFKINNIKLLGLDGDELKTEYFKLNYSVLLDENSFDGEFIENEGDIELKLSTYFYQKSGKDSVNVYKLPIYFKPDKIADVDAFKKNCLNMFNAGKGQVRKMHFSGSLYNGKEMANVEELEVDEELKNLYESGFISEAEYNRTAFGEVKYLEKIYANTILFNSETKGAKKDDTMYTIEDLKSIPKKDKKPKEKKVEQKVEVEDFSIDDEDLPF